MFIPNHIYMEQLIDITDPLHGPLSSFVELQVAHALGMPGTFSPPPTKEETAS